MNKNIKTIIIVGSGPEIGRQLTEAFSNVKLKHHYKPNIIVIEDNKQDISTIEVNGIKYQRIERDKLKSGKSGKFGMATAMLAALTPSMNFGGSDYKRKRPKIDLIREYGLIELKQSELCRADRDWVKWQFEYNYKKI